MPPGVGLVKAGLGLGWHPAAVALEFSRIGKQVEAQEDDQRPRWPQVSRADAGRVQAEQAQAWQTPCR